MVVEAFLQQVKNGASVYLFSSVTMGAMSGQALGRERTLKQREYGYIYGAQVALLITIVFPSPQARQEKTAARYSSWMGLIAVISINYDNYQHLDRGFCGSIMAAVRRCRYVGAG